MFRTTIVTALISLLAGPAAAEELQDPMAPFSLTLGSASGPVAADFVLSAIIIGEQRRVAIINDQAYQVGHQVGSYQLTVIEPNRVQMTSDGTNRTLVLNTASAEKSDDPS